MIEEKTTIAKIARPKFSGVLQRERLFQLLDAGIHQPVIWVAGPAGSGKSALVSSYLKERSLPYLWYRLDKRDEDLSAFFHYIRLAARNAAPGEWPPMPALITQDFQGLSAFARQLFELLCARLAPPFALVFDDYHELGANWTIRNIFNKALSEILEGVCCILISRSQPEAEFARFASYGRLHYIDWEALRFTLEETRQLVRGDSRTSPPPPGGIRAGSVLDMRARGERRPDRTDIPEDRRLGRRADHGHAGCAGWKYL